MNKSKIFTVALACTLALSACVDDKESATVTELRGAKAKFLDAQTARELALASYQDMLTEMEKAVKEAELADKKVALEQAQIELEKSKLLLEESQMSHEKEMERLKQELANQKLQNPALITAQRQYREAYGEINTLTSTLASNKLSLAQAEILLEEQIAAKEATLPATIRYSESQMRADSVTIDEQTERLEMWNSLLADAKVSQELISAKETEWAQARNARDKYYPTLLAAQKAETEAVDAYNDFMNKIGGTTLEELDLLIKQQEDIVKEQNDSITKRTERLNAAKLNILPLDKKVKDAEAAIKTKEDAVKTAKDALKDAEKAATDAANAVANAQKKLDDAKAAGKTGNDLKPFEDALKLAQADQVVADAEKVKKEKAVTDAQEAVTKAQEAAAKAQTAYNDNITDITSLENLLQQAKDSIVNANNLIADYKKQKEEFGGESNQRQALYDKMIAAQAASQEAQDKYGELSDIADAIYEVIQDLKVLYASGELVDGTPTTVSVNIEDIQDEIDACHRAIENAKARILENKKNISQAQSDVTIAVANLKQAIEDLKNTIAKDEADLKYWTVRFNDAKAALDELIPNNA